MKLLHSSDEDTRKPEEYISDWKADRRINFTGPRRGRGNECLTIEIDDSDVIALFTALIEDLKDRELKQTKEIRSKLGSLRMRLTGGASNETLLKFLDEMIRDIDGTPGDLITSSKNTPKPTPPRPPFFALRLSKALGGRDIFNHISVPFSRWHPSLKLCPLLCPP